MTLASCLTAWAEPWRYPSDAVGKYVGVRHGKGFLVREMRLDLESGRYQLKTF